MYLPHKLYLFEYNIVMEIFLLYLFNFVPIFEGYVTHEANPKLVFSKSLSRLRLKMTSDLDASFLDFFGLDLNVFALNMASLSGWFLQYRGYAVVIS